MQIIGLVMETAIALGLILLLIRLRYERIVKQIWRSLRVEPNNMVFTPEMVAELDEPVHRLNLELEITEREANEGLSLEYRLCFTSFSDFWSINHLRSNQSKDCGS